ncbi:MAG: DUF503 domain-containing protein [Planctomycetota bacterium]|nr:MAG: DUF503 domain-containing protein [Planctomycetota bacterium]
MVIGVLQFELRIADADSLKAKRRVVRSLKDRLHRAHQVSVAEVGLHEIAERALLGVALAAPTPPRAAAVLDAVVAKLHALTDAELVSLQRQIAALDALPEPPAAPLGAVFDADALAAAGALLDADDPGAQP